MQAQVIFSQTHASQLHITPDTPMGAHLVQDGATFRVWAPAALGVYIITGADFAGSTPPPSSLLLQNHDGTWTGFVSGVTEGTPYRFYVVGEGSFGLKRDPCARELGSVPSFPNCNCLVR